MTDLLSESDALLLHQAIAYRKASKLAEVIFTLNNVMNCIKVLMVEQSDKNPLVN